MPVGNLLALHDTCACSLQYVLSARYDCCMTTACLCRPLQLFLASDAAGNWSCNRTASTDWIQAASIPLLPSSLRTPYPQCLPPAACVKTCGCSVFAGPLPVSPVLHLPFGGIQPITVPVAAAAVAPPPGTKGNGKRPKLTACALAIMGLQHLPEQQGTAKEIMAAVEADSALARHLNR